MPIPAMVGAAAAAAGGNMLGDVMNNIAVATQNRKSRQWADKVRAQDRQWALDDWERNNTYNSPQQQMNRLQEAGLNPRLMYGSSSAGGGNADQVRGISTQTPTFQAAEFQSPGQIGSTLAQYMNWETQMLQNDNLKKQGDVLAAEAANKIAGTNYTNAQTARSGFDLDLESELRPYSLDFRKGQVAQQNAQTAATLSDTEQRVLANSQNLLEGAERILNMRADRARTGDERRRIRADLERIRADTQLKKLDADLKRLGIQPHDPLYLRFAGRYLSNYGFSIPENLKNLFSKKSTKSGVSW